MSSSNALSKTLIAVFGLMIVVAVLAWSSGHLSADQDPRDRRPLSEPRNPPQEIAPEEIGPATIETLCDTEDFRDLADRVIWSLYEGHPTLKDTAAVLISSKDMNNSQAHDCQRLAEGRSFGPLVALMISTRRVERDPFLRPSLVADIVNHSASVYAPLGIPAGLSCLWLRPDPDADSGLSAAIEPSDRTACVGEAAPPASAFSLEVRRLQIEKGGGVYPSTGRWMWDDSARQQFIGIRCGEGWCEIGEPGFTGTAAIPMSRDVPGWFDEQYLAVPGPGGQTLRPSNLYGRIVPGIDNKAVENRSPTSWAEAGASAKPMHVATMYFDGQDSAAWDLYADKLGLRRSAQHGPHGFMYRATLRRTFPIPFLGRTDTIREVQTPQGPWIRVNRCNTSHAGSGTVRWAWSEDDEGFWVPCEEGCCLVHGALE